MAGHMEAAHSPTALAAFNLCGTPWNLAQIPLSNWQGWLHLEGVLMPLGLALQRGLTLMDPGECREAVVNERQK